MAASGLSKSVVPSAYPPGGGRMNTRVVSLLSVVLACVSPLSAQETPCIVG